ncbi:transducin beta-like protein 3 [Sitophilus oryzae]|uniref:Transducin beta-like protein 3 n=1 Tax=Sitophilus oryzae TaxID=7048 RepID=A0A6J2XUW5_SITOR|nr:transducin beta-like protein 3 [Sitophilus oryzae]
MPVKLKEIFDVESKHGAFYTGGSIQWLEDTLYCQTESVINLFDIETGTVVRTIGTVGELEEIDTIQTFTTDGDKIVSSHKSGLMKLWNQNGELEKMWKYIHKGPLAKLALKDTRLVSGGSDSIVRVWDLQYQACILSLKGCQGVVNVVEFSPKENTLFASGDSGKIYCYELVKGEVKNIYDGHYSKVTAIAFTHDNQHFVSCGRDKVLILWQLGKTVALKTIPVYEAVEVVVSLPSKFKLPGFKADADSIYVASGGENGVIKVWDLLKAKEVFVQSDSMVSKATEEGGLSITHLMYNKKSKSIAVVTFDHNIIIHNLKSFVCLKQFIGFSDEILDISYLGENDTHIAVATNSKDIKLYDNSTMSCQILKGHEDIVLSLTTCRSNHSLLLSSSKDNSIRLWQFDGATAKCVGVGKRHTGSVGSVTFSNLSSEFCVSASQDTCLKLWEIPQDIINKNGKDLSLNCTHTAIAHQKEINSVAVSPNDKIIASASQDKTVKLWNERLELMGVLKGHKRGVWCVRFSPVDQVVLTSSADCTVKLWSVVNFNCLKTLDGHESSVLKVEFLTKGLQIVSAGADGLIKLFNIKNSECQCTLDQHEGRIWALAVRSDESEITTGGSDSFLIKWKDITEERKQQQQKELDEIALQEQKLSNYLQSDNLLKALKLALKLNRPLQTLKIINSVIKKGDTGLTETIKSLRNDQKESLLNCALDWNTNSRNCQPAQLVLNILLNELQTKEFRPVGLSKITEGALPYTDRHFKRITQLMQDIKFINYTVNCMQPHSRNVNIGQ